MKVALCTDRKARAAIYRNAARLGELGEGDGSCIWLVKAQEWRVHYDDCPLVRKYEALFSPQEGVGAYWGNQWAGIHQWENTKAGGQFARNCRVLALCFMAAMVEAGDA